MSRDYYFHFDYPIIIADNLLEARRKLVQYIEETFRNEDEYDCTNMENWTFDKSEDNKNK